MSIDQKNLLGNSLESCCESGMAMTGFKRTGLCESSFTDSGSHHICMDLSKLKHNFCDYTNQENWCSRKLPCHENPSENCDVKNWCVCEWAFRDYVNKVSCQAIENDVLKCDAISDTVLDHYRNQNDPATQYALECLKSKCFSESFSSIRKTSSENYPHGSKS